VVACRPGQSPRCARSPCVSLQKQMPVDISLVGPRWATLILGGGHGAWVLGLQVSRSGPVWRHPEAWVAESRAVEPEYVFVYRACCALLGAAVVALQLYARGTAVLKYFTVLTWCCMTLYFLLAATATLRYLGRVNAAAAARKEGDAKGRPKPPKDMSRLGFAVTALFNMLGCSTLNVTLTTWLLLWPMLRNHADPEVTRVAKQLLFNWTSNLQHGGNLGLLLADAVLTDVPLSPSLFFGVQSLYSAAYTFFVMWFRQRHGWWIYVFLDHELPHARWTFAVFFVVHWVFYGLFAGAVVYLRRLLRRSDKTD